MTARPRIVLDALVLRPRPTGVGRSVLELIRALAQRDRGFDFLVLTTAPELFGSLADTPGWRVRECRGARGGVLVKAAYTQWAVPRICRRERADLLHNLQFMGTLRAPCPLVVTVHDLTWLDHPDTIEQPRLAYYRWLAPRALARADRIVANSRTTADGLRRADPQWGAKVEETPFGTPSWVWASRERVLAGQAETGEAVNRGDRPYFLFVSTLEPRKNLSGMLHAYEDFVARAEAEGRSDESIPDFHLVGPRGWKDGSLRREIERLRATGRLKILDYRSGDDLWRRYHLARGLFFASLHEGFGFPILEAMSAELPVLTSDRDSMAEVAGDCALQVDPEDRNALAAAMERLAWDEPLRLRLGREGLERARAWNWERTAQTTCAVYRDVLDAK